MIIPWFTGLPWVHYIDFKRKELYHAARFEKDMRYYIIRLSKDLFGDWVITLINGRIKSKLGQSRSLAFSNFNEAFDVFCQQAKLRHQRNYKFQSIHCENQILLDLLPFLTSLENYEEMHNANIVQSKKNRSARTSFQTSNNRSQTPQLNHRQMGFSF